MSKYNTIDIWNVAFGRKEETYDYTGRLIKKSACGNPNSKYHPTLDHIRPLSKGGSGDILSGIIAGLLGYKDTLDAALVGSYILGKCGDLAIKEYGSYATLPRDIINLLKEIMKKY